MTYDHFVQIHKFHEKIGEWIKKVTFAGVELDRIETTDLGQVQKVFIKPKHQQYATKLWRTYTTFNDRTAKLAARPFKEDAEFEANKEKRND